MSFLLSVLAHTADGRWHPGIGDPTFLGWFTVAAYAWAAYYAYLALRSSRARVQELGPVAQREQRNVVRLWLFVLIVLVLLGINKQLDLQTLFTETLRDLARAQGWFGQRRAWQARFIMGLVASALLGVGAGVFLLRHVLRRARPALLGLTVLGTFVLVRASHFHHADILRRGVRFHWVLELLGIALLVRAAHLETRNVRSEHWATKPADSSAQPLQARDS